MKTLLSLLAIIKTKDYLDEDGSLNSSAEFRAIEELAKYGTQIINFPYMLKICQNLKEIDPGKIYYKGKIPKNIKQIQSCRVKELVDIIMAYEICNSKD